MASNDPFSALRGTAKAAFFEPYARLVQVLYPRARGVIFYDAAGKIVMPGVITHSTDVVEHPELVSQRIQRFAKLVGKENVIASADCGFGGRSHPQIAWAKLKALGDGAKRATQALKYA